MESSVSFLGVVEKRNLDVAKIAGQNIPSEHFEDYQKIFFPTRGTTTGFMYYLGEYEYVKLVSGLMHQIQAQKKGTTYPQVSEKQGIARCKFRKSSQAANEQVESGGAEYPETGPRNKKWWYDNIPPGNCYWNDYCIQETFPHMDYYRKPPWAIPPTIWICATNNNRLEKWDGRAMSLEDYTGGGIGPGEDFGAVTRAAVDDERVYVCDYTNNKIHILNKETLEYIGNFSKTSDDKHTFSDPYDIAVDDKNIFITEWKGTTLIIVDKNDFKLVRKIIVSSPNDWTDPQIKGVTVDHNFVSVADWINGAIKIYSRRTFSIVKEITIKGYGDAQILYATGIVSDGNNIYAIDPSHFSNYTCNIALGEVVNINEYADPVTGGIGLSGDLVFVMGDMDNTLYKLVRTLLIEIDRLNNPGTDPGEFALNQGVCGEQAFYWDAC